MNRTGFKLAVALFSAGLSWIGVARGQENAVPPKGEPSTEPKAAPKNRETDKLGPRVRAQMGQVQRLRQLMDEKIELSASQKAAIDRLVHDWTEDVANTLNHARRGDATRPDNKVLPPHVPQLEKELARAKVLGDEAKADQIGQAIAMLRKEPVTPADNFTEPLISRIRAELNPEQIPVFDQVAQRWDAIVPRGPRTGAFHQFRRALQDPEVGLSTEQKAEADQLLQTAMKTARSGKYAPERLGEELEKAKKTIYEKLTEEQRRKIEADLRSFEELEKNYGEIKPRRAGAVPKPAVTAKDGEKKESPTDSKPKTEGEPTKDSAPKP